MARRQKTATAAGIISYPGEVAIYTNLGKLITTMVTVKAVGGHE